jgi:hypothetical protein
LTEEKHKRHTQKIKASFVAITLVFLLTLGLFGWLLLDIRDLTTKTAKLSKTTAHLTLENTKRIKEIQESRVFSCRSTYRGVRRVFRPFFPKNPTTRQQRVTIVKFNRVINRLVKGCEKQTAPKQPKGH